MYTACVLRKCRAIAITVLLAVGGCDCGGDADSSAAEDEAGDPASSRRADSNDCTPERPVDSGGSMVCRIGGDGRVRCAGTGFAMGNYDDVLGEMVDSRKGFSRAIRTDAGRARLRKGIEQVLAESAQKRRQRMGLVRKVIPDIEDAVAVTVSGLHACAIDCSGSLFCWGVNLAGNLGDGTTKRRDRPVTPEKLPPVKAADAGEGHTCAVDRGGRVHCWGDNELGQCGEDADWERQLTPHKVQGIGGAVDVALGELHSCALHEGGTVTCWGGGGPTRTDPPSDAVFRRLELKGVDVLVSGDHHVCALRDDGSVWCWGENSRFDGKVRPGDDARFILEPTRVDVPAMNALAAGADHTCGITEGGSAHCWGSDRDGRLGRRSQQLPPLRTIAAGKQHSCGLAKDDGLYCWGRLGAHFSAYAPRRLQLDRNHTATGR